MVQRPEKPKILVLIDDNRVDLKINSVIAGHTQLFEETRSFYSAKSALDYLTAARDNPNIPSMLILLDIQMPEMDGFDFMEEYQKLPAPFIAKCFVAMLSSTDDEVDASRANANPHIIRLLKKPLHPNILKELLTEFFD